MGPRSATSTMSPVRASRHNLSLPWQAVQTSVPSAVRTYVNLSSSKTYRVAIPQHRRLAAHGTLILTTCGHDNSSPVCWQVRAGQRCVVVTGASTGIGLGTVGVLVQQGYHVCGSVRKAADGERLQDAFGTAFTPLLFDITEEAAVKAAAMQVPDVLASAWSP